MDGEAQPSRGCASHFDRSGMSKSPKEVLEKRLSAVGHKRTKGFDAGLEREESANHIGGQVTVPSATLHGGTLVRPPKTDVSAADLSFSAADFFFCRRFFCLRPASI